MRTRGPAVGQVSNLSGQVGNLSHNGLPGSARPSLLVLIVLTSGPLLADNPRSSPLDHQGQRILAPPEPLFNPPGHTTEVYTVAVSADGKRFASASNREVKVWDAGTGKEVSTYPIKGTNVFGLAFSPDGSRLAVGVSKQLKLLDPATGAEVTSFAPTTHFLFRLAFRPDGKHVAAASGSNCAPGEAVVWEAATGKQLFRLGGHAHQVLAVAYSPDGKLLATAGGAVSGSQPGVIKLWDSATGRELMTLEGHPENVYAVAFSPDGRRLATGAGQARNSPKPGAVKVWELSTGKEVAEFGVPGGPVFAVTYSPDGRRLAAAGGDKVIRVRDPYSGSLVADWPAHAGTVFSLAFTPDGKRLASAGQDKAVKVWDAPGTVRAVAPMDTPRTAREARALAHDLAGSDATRAYRALAALAAAPDLAVAAVRDRLRTIAMPTAADREQAAGWVRDLDHADFRVRERASRALASAGAAAPEAVRSGLAKDPSPEARERLERLLASLADRPPTAEEIAADRVLELLEHVGTGEARTELKALAAGYPEARLTHDAAAALKRMGPPGP
jgi:WD40 repeat protein